MRIRCIGLITSVLLTASSALAADHKDLSVSDWNRFTAAQYLDARQQWWMDWPKAQRDHETACVSCHTALPYAMARPSLREPLGNQTLSTQEQRMLGYVVKRVTLWREVQPFYTDEKSGPRKSPESRGTEAVLNALVLARYDNASGHMRQITKDAFTNMWPLQLTTGEEKGSWDWLNFHNAPWESNESHYWGATLAAVAVGITPDNYRARHEIQPQLALLSEYLNRDYDNQPLINRVGVLWASARIPGLLTPAQRMALLKDIARHQQTDGGWTTATLGPWKRKDDTSLDTASDGYATGLIVYAMRQAGIPASSAAMQQGRKWLIANQAADGHWNAISLNKQRESTADPAKFMSDAATAYASLALSSLQEP